MHVCVIYSLLPLVQMLVYVVVQLVEDFESESTTRDLAIGHSKVSGPTSLTSPLFPGPYGHAHSHTCIFYLSRAAKERRRSQ